MARSLGNLIADSVNRGILYAEKLLLDVSDERFGRFAAPDGTPIVSNHPAFLFGHLAFYPPKMLADLGLEPTKLPENYESLFSKTATCVDDPEGTIYPAKKEIVEYFYSGYRTVIKQLREIDDAAFDKPNPLPKPASEVFPTVGSMHVFYGSGHIALHLGQMSAWRRMESLGAA